MNIVTVSCHLSRAFDSLGHRVLEFTPRGPFFNLLAAIEETGFEPDLIFQQEHLGSRVFLQGLDQIHCPKIFWSVDSHLNLFWHRHYARLFDGLLTPHLSLLKPFSGSLPPLGRLAWYGRKFDWVPFARRKRHISFVGRITETRPRRQWLADFLLERYDACIRNDLSLKEMFDFYADTRLAPNESIAMEVNFRLLEAASCGCLVLSPEVGQDQDVLLQPGKEIETYGHVLELEAKLDYYFDNPDKAEHLARAGWLRVQAEHLPEHRAQSVLQFAQGLPASAASGEAGQTEWWLAMYELRRTGRVSIPGHVIAGKLAGLPQTAPVLAARIRHLAESGSLEQAAEFLKFLFDLNESDLDLNLACSMAALRLNSWDMALEFLRRQSTALGLELSPPAAPPGLCLEWAWLIVEHGVLDWPGSCYDPSLHIPCAALDCLHLARHLGGDPELVDRTGLALLDGNKSNDYLKMGYASDLSLRHPDDWRLGLDLALFDLRNFRREAGIEELFSAYQKAVELDEAHNFHGHLQILDPRGTMAAVLENLTRQRPEG